MLGGASGVVPRPLGASAPLCAPATRRSVEPREEAPSGLTVVGGVDGGSTFEKLYFQSEKITKNQFS